MHRLTGRPNLQPGYGRDQTPLSIQSRRIISILQPIKQANIIMPKPLQSIKRTGTRSKKVNAALTTAAQANTNADD